MNIGKKITAAAALGLDEPDYVVPETHESFLMDARALMRDPEFYSPTRRGKIACREIAPNTFLGLTSERHRMSVLQIDDDLFIFAPSRLSRPRLESLVTRLLTQYALGSAQRPAAATFESLTAG